MLTLFGQLFQPRNLRIALALLRLFVGARFFLGSLATLALHRDARFYILFDTFTLRYLLRRFAQCDLPSPHFRQRFMFGILPRFPFRIELQLTFAIRCLAHLLLDQHARLSLYFRFLLGL